MATPGSIAFPPLPQLWEVSWGLEAVEAEQQVSAGALLWLVRLGQRSCTQMLYAKDIFQFAIRVLKIIRLHIHFRCRFLCLGWKDLVTVASHFPAG
jgi:hypothetical protein